MVSIDIKICIDKIEFTIFKNSDGYKREINQGKIAIPNSFSKGEQLKYIRKIIATTISQYSVKKASINMEEDAGIGVIGMVKIEGVIEELLASYEVDIWR
ncbi:hypothetical protein [Romboutsia sp.]|uniref:hypothetical protein n=1 Tax=Romboutsia sp. TaxID=1965302 RepID=UPI003F2C8076